MQQRERKPRDRNPTTIETPTIETPAATPVLDIGDTATYEFDVPDQGTAVYKVTLKDVNLRRQGGQANTEIVFLVENVSNTKAYDLNKEYAVDDTDFRHDDIKSATEDQLTDPGPGQRKIVNLEYNLPKDFDKGRIVFVTFDEETFSEPDAFAVRID